MYEPSTVSFESDGQNRQRLLVVFAMQRQRILTGSNQAREDVQIGQTAGYVESVTDHHCLMSDS
jgi:hypothetical protein